MRFLKAGDKVKITIMFRGREQHRPELGFRLLQRLAEDVTELGFVESAPKQDGRNMIMVLGPHKKKAEAKVEMQAAKADRMAARAAEEAEERAERTRAQRRAGGGAEEGPRPLREPRSRDRGLSEARRGLDPGRSETPVFGGECPHQPPHERECRSTRPHDERGRENDAEEQDALRCEQAVQGDRLGQAAAREGRQAPQPGEEALQGDPSHDRHRDVAKADVPRVKKLLGR